MNAPLQYTRSLNEFVQITTTAVDKTFVELFASEEAMQLFGSSLIVQRLVTAILYKLLRLIFIPVQRIYWQLNGTARKLREARLPDNYERSAQVLNVLLCHKFCHSQATTVDDFLCTHNRFENPQYIVDNDNITLLTVNERDAVFCETEEKGTRVHCRTYWTS